MAAKRYGVLSLKPPLGVTMDINANLGSLTQHMEKRIGIWPMKVLFWSGWIIGIFAVISVAPYIYQTAWQPLLEGSWKSYNWSEMALKVARYLGLFSVSMGLGLGIIKLAMRYYFEPRMQGYITKNRESLETLKAQTEEAKSLIDRASERTRVANEQIRVANEATKEAVQRMAETKAIREQVTSMMAKLEDKMEEGKRTTGEPSELSAARSHRKSTTPENPPH